MGQKVPIERPRVRTTEEKEVRLGSYEMFHRGEPLTETVWEKLMLGLSTRKYGQAVREFTEAYGLEKSAVSEHFIEASRAKLKEMMERRLDKTRLCALLIDATPFEGSRWWRRWASVKTGAKRSWASGKERRRTRRWWASCWATWWSRGLDFTEPRLYVLDGGKALTRGGEEACRRIGGDPALPGPQAAQRAGSSDR